MKLFIKESALNEGAGAGYTIEIKGLSNIGIKNARVIDFQEIDEWTKGWIVEVNGYCTIDTLKADSYYYGTGDIENVSADILKVYVNWYSTADDVELRDMDKATLCSYISDYLYENFNEMKFNFGGGWMHSTYDGTIGDINDKSGDEVELKITDSEVINYIDKAVQGENTYTQYDIIVDGDTYDTVEDEEEAIRVAEELSSSEDYADSQISVETYNVLYDFYGTPIDDLGVTETIWEN